MQNREYKDEEIERDARKSPIFEACADRDLCVLLCIRCAVLLSDR